MPFYDYLLCCATPYNICQLVLRLCCARRWKMSLGPQCCSNPPELSSSSSGAGSLTQIGGLKAYGSADSNRAVILISDVYGYEPPKLRKIADKVAAAGFYVVVPDFFYGDPYVLDIPDRPIAEWLKSHEPVKGFEDAKPLISALKSKGISAIGAAGFCWGAKVVVELAKSDHIQAAVMLHPSFVIVDDIKDVKAPIAILGAEFDHLSPPELIKQFEDVLSTKPEVKSFVKIFPGVSHGWSVRYKDDAEHAIRSAEEAHKDTINWFIEYVK